MRGPDITEPLTGATLPDSDQGNLGAGFAARRSAPFFVFDPEGFPDPMDDASRERTDALCLNSPAPVPNDLHEDGVGDV